MRLPDVRRWWRQRRESPFTRDEALAARPVRNPAIAWERQDNGKVLLTVPLQLKPWMRLLKPLLQVPQSHQVELDEVGSDVWGWLDGDQSLEDLAKRLAKTHKLNAREAEVSLAQFLQTLARRRFVGFEPVEVEADSSAANPTRRKELEAALRKGTH